MCFVLAEPSPASTITPQLARPFSGTWASSLMRAGLGLMYQMMADGWVVEAHWWLKLCHPMPHFSPPFSSSLPHFPLSSYWLQGSVCAWWLNLGPWVAEMANDQSSFRPPKASSGSIGLKCRWLYGTCRSWSPQSVLKYITTYINPVQLLISYWKGLVQSSEECHTSHQELIKQECSQNLFLLQPSMVRERPGPRTGSWQQAWTSFKSRIELSGKALRIFVL